MAEKPAMPLWTDAYLGDTGHLTTLEHGAYLLLLMTMWRAGGSLPNDDTRLARFARLTPAQWGRIKPKIMEFFHVEDGELVQGRLTDELNFVRRKSKAQSLNARAKWRKHKQRADATAEPRQCQPDAPTPTPFKKKDISSETSSDNVDTSRKKGRAKYPEPFERLWALWQPVRPNQSKQAAFDRWRMFAAEQQEAMEVATPLYFDACRREGRSAEFILHLERFIGKRVFDQFVEYDDDGGESENRSSANGRNATGSGSDNPGNGGMGCVADLEPHERHLDGVPGAARPRDGPGEHVLGSEPLADDPLQLRGAVAEQRPLSLPECLGFAAESKANGAAGDTGRRAPPRRRSNPQLH